MKLSLSIETGEVIKEKSNFLEDLLTGFSSKKKLPLDEISQLVQENVINGIELKLSAETKEDDLSLINETLINNKVPVLSIHQPVLKILKINFESIVELFKAAKKLSARLVVIHLFALGKNIHDSDFVQKLKHLEREYGIRIGLENSTKNLFTNFWGPGSWDEKYFSEAVTKAGFEITLDTTHMGYSKGDIINFYNKNQKRIINIHLSDYKGNILGMHKPLGEGCLPIRDFLELLKRSKYQEIVTLEINSGWEKIQNSVKLVRSLIK